MPRRPSAVWLVVWVTAGAVATARGQEPAAPVHFPGESAGTERRLADAAKQAADGQVAAAVDEYLRILDEAGDDLVPVDGRHSVAARWLCHAGLAALPEAGLRRYRERTDVAARKWWDQASAARDVAGLRRVVAEAFCSRVGDRALDLLGDLAFESGALAEAERWWAMLAPLDSPGSPAPGPAPVRLVFPDPGVDVARVRAKQLLVRLLTGERADFGAALEAYRARHGKAAGDLVGRHGAYADLLAGLAGRPDALANPVREPPWPTFGGDAGRGQAVPAAPRRLRLAEPAWSVRLTGPPGERPEAGPAPSGPTAAARALVYYPAMADGLVVVSDGRRVSAYDLRTGAPAGTYELPEAGAGLGLPDEAPTAGAAHTLTVADGRVYARLGLPARVVRPQRQPGAAGQSFLVCLDRAAGRLTPRWQVKAQDRRSEQAVFEGAPVVWEGRAYAARTALAEGRVATAIDCYNADTGARLWRQDVCDARGRPDDQPRPLHYLVTLAGANVAYCTHAGAVVAVDALTGRRAWAVRYPPREPGGDEPPPADPAPCLYAGGRLFVAPRDYDRVLCLDPATGAVFWESQPLEVVQVLGLAHNRLVVTTTTRPRGIRGLDVATGRIVREWVQPDDGSSELPSFGRGLLAGGNIWWPTFYGLRVLRQADGQPVALDGRPLGNLALGEGCLAVADADELRVYLPPDRLPGGRPPPRVPTVFSARR